VLNYATKGAKELTVLNGQTKAATNVIATPK